jgi:hypothetical protein
MLGERAFCSWIGQNAGEGGMNKIQTKAIPLKTLQLLYI